MDLKIRNKNLIIENRRLQFEKTNLVEMFGMDLLRKRVRTYRVEGPYSKTKYSKKFVLQII